MKPEDVKKEQELQEEELDNVSGGLAPRIEEGRIIIGIR